MQLRSCTKHDACDGDRMMTARPRLSTHGIRKVTNPARAGTNRDWAGTNPPKAGTNPRRGQSSEGSTARRTMRTPRAIAACPYGRCINRPQCHVAIPGSSRTKRNPASSAHRQHCSGVGCMSIDGPLGVSGSTFQWMIPNLPPVCRTRTASRSSATGSSMWSRSPALSG